jgi:threonine synthase
MKYISTNQKSAKVSFREAVIKGIPDDNGLFYPETLNALSSGFFKKLKRFSLSEIAFEVMKVFVQDDIPDQDLIKILNDTLSFDIPLVKLEPNVYSLELFHGPTLAFKDIGARFLARCMSYFSGKDEKITVLVATSGDTGSAVANGFLGIKGIDVVILFPKGKVSELQEKQFSTLGNNINSLEVEGTFDDCQNMVKKAFADPVLHQKMKLSSANSINIARLIPQTFYYFYAYSQLEENINPRVVSVPSGNYGNLTAGLMAKKLGLAIDEFIAASNINKPVPDYLETGQFIPRTSVQTIANAMDVGNPGNFARIQTMYDYSWEAIREDVKGYSYFDDQVKNIMKTVYNKTGYILDPHGAIGYLALKDYMLSNDVCGIFLETAHPAKFYQIVEDTIRTEIDIPARLLQCLDKGKKTILIKNQYDDLRDFLRSKL